MGDRVAMRVVVGALALASSAQAGPPLVLDPHVAPRPLRPPPPEHSRPRGCEDARRLLAAPGISPAQRARLLPYLATQCP